MANQDIPIKLLKLGMFVTGIDVPWLDSPFLRHSFKISKQQDIQKMLDAGVKIVTIECDKSDVLPSAAELKAHAAELAAAASKNQTPEEPDNPATADNKEEPQQKSALKKPENESQSQDLADDAVDDIVDDAVQGEPQTVAEQGAEDGAEDSAEEGPEDGVDEEPEEVGEEPSEEATEEELEEQEQTKAEKVAPASLVKELGAARKLHAEANILCAEVFESLGAGKAINVNRVKELVARTVESLTRNNQALFSFLHMQRKGEGLHEHAFSVFSLSLALAIAFDVKKADQELLGFAALVHDVGWLKLPLHLFGKGKAYSEAERDLISKHPLLTARMIDGGEGVNDKVKSLVAFHHESLDGSGYPTGKQVEPDLLRSLLVVADQYDELVHQLLDRPGKIPKSALRELFVGAQKGQLDVNVVQRLITLLGVYPISSAVELKNGEKAVVIECFYDAPAQPLIRIFYDKRGALKPKSEDLNLREINEDDQRQILKAIDWRVSGVDPADILNLESIRVG